MKKFLVGFIAFLITINSFGLLVLPVAGVEAGRKYGGTFIIADTADVDILNPLLVRSGSTWRRVNEIFNGLVNLDRNLDIMPDLAESWEISEDGLTYTFHLRKGVKWHDGEDFTSADVKFTYDQYILIPEELPQTLKFSSINSIDAPDPHTVIFHLKEPNAALMIIGFAGGTGTEILPKHLYEGTDIHENPYNFNPVGTGPFKFEEWKKGEHMTLVRNENYFKEGQPYLDRIIFKVMPSMSSQLITIEIGEAHYILNPLPPYEVARLQAIKNLDVTIVSPLGGEIMWIYLNLKNPHLENLKVRQAIAHAMNKEEFINMVAGGVGKPLLGPIPSTIGWAYTPDVTKYEYDPVKAEELLDEAGYPRGADGIRFTIRSFPRAGDPRREDAAEIFKAQMVKVGIEVDIQMFEWATLVSKLTKESDFDTYWNLGSMSPDPDGIYKVFHSSGIFPGSWGNVCNYNNSRIDWILDEQRRTTDVSKRGELWQEFHQILAEELPVFWVYETQNAYVSNTDFRGIPHGLSLNSENVWWVFGKTTEDIRLSETVEDITTEISELTGDLTELSSNLETLSEDLASSIGEVSGSIDSMADLIGNVRDDLKSDITGVPESISKLKGTVNTNQMLIAINFIGVIATIILLTRRKS